MFDRFLGILTVFQSSGVVKNIRYLLTALLSAKRMNIFFGKYFAICVKLKLSAE